MRSVVCLFAVLAITAQADNRLMVLVEQGSPRATIVLADRPYLAAEYGAEVLNRYLEAATGATLPIRSAAEMDTLDEDQAWILIGDSPLVRQLDLEVDDLPFGSYRMVMRDNMLVIVGRDHVHPLGNGEAVEPHREDVVHQVGQETIGWGSQRISLDEAARHEHVSGGSLFGVYRLLEEELDIRWLWPGELGTVIPQRRELRIGERDETHVPAMAKRTPRNHSPERVDPVRQRRAFGELVLPEDQRLARFESDEWFRAHHLGHDRVFAATHALGEWAERFVESRPDFFGYQHLGGSREQRANRQDRRHLCLSNEDVVAAYAERVQQMFAADPYRWVASASPSDSVRRGHCMCDDCRALDEPAGEPVTLLDGDTREAFDYVQLTDRYVNWWNRVAQTLEGDYADRMIGAWAYDAYRAPPLREQVHPQVGIGFVGLGHRWLNDTLRAEDLAIWDGWSERAGYLMLRPNPLDIAGVAFPLNVARRIQEEILQLHNRQMQAFEGYTYYGHWSSLGLSYYVLPRLLWDPATDVEALIDDYCRAGFGPAADQVRAYFDLLEVMTDEIAALEGAHSAQGVIWRSRYMADIGQAPPRMVLGDVAQQPGVDLEALGDDAERDIEAVPEGVRRRVIPQERVRLIAMVFMDYHDRLESLLAKAAALAADAPDPAYEQRVQFLQHGLTYARLEAVPLVDWYDAPEAEMLDRLAERDAYLSALKDRYALDVPRILERQGRYGMTSEFYSRTRSHHLP